MNLSLLLLGAIKSSRMASDSEILQRSSHLRRGDYGAPSTADLRSPCPVVNALANHGYIPRDGRNVRSDEMYAAMAELGASRTVRATLTFGSCKYVRKSFVPFKP